MTTAPERQRLSVEDRATVWLAMGIVALPWLQTVEWDFDRSAPLAVVPVALFAGHAALSRAFARIARAHVAWRACGAFVVLAAIIATAASSHRAASLAQLASWTLVALAAILTGQLVAEDRRRAGILLGALALSGAIATVMHWTRWQLGASSQTAFYPHHRLMGLHALGAALAATSLVATARRFTAAWLIVGAITWGGLLWTGSRSPLVGVAVALAAWGLRGSPDIRRKLLYGTLAHVIGGLLLSTLLRADEPALGWANTVGRTIAAESAQQLTSNRSEFWAGAWRQVIQSPAIGYGPDAYRHLEPKLEGNQAHNVELQWLVEFGAFGALAAIAMLASLLIRAWRNLPSPDATAGWNALAIASFTAGQLDGFFYHLAGLFTTALAIGVSGFASRPGVPQLDPMGELWKRAWPAVFAAAVGVLTLHTWLFNRVALARPPDVNDLAARAWRAFPSTTLGLDRWIDAWEKPQPDAALAAARLAARQSPNGDYYRVKTAGLLLRRGDVAAAQAELAYAVSIAPPALRPVIAQLQQQLAAEKTKR